MSTLTRMVRDRRPSRDVRPRRWSDLTDRQRTGVVTLGLIEVTLTVAAAVDLVRRPSGSVRGPKAVWWPAIFVQPIGPVAYLLVGRRR